MRRPKIGDRIFSTEFFGLMLFAFAAGFPPFDDAAEVDLSLHMLQHILIAFSGILIAYPHYGRRLIGRRGDRWLPILAFVGSASVIVFWHMPVPWDDAVVNPGIHVVEHLSFLFVGILAGSWLLLLSDSGKIGSLLAAFFGHMGYAVALISPWGVQVYPLYSLQDQVTLGWILLLSGPLLVVGVAYVIARNPDWLGGFSDRVPRASGRRQTFLNGVKVPRWVVPMCTFALVAAFVGYFTLTAYALGTAQPVTGSGPKVYIVETPVYWQYSPQQIRVVLGLNSTVIWASRSISYDTVTDRGGTFDSGIIAPAGTFSHTFTAPGTYSYYCQFHPWMTGTVVVVAAG